MNVGACVLIYGRDPLLLQTHGQVLRQGGFRVVTISQLEEFFRLQVYEIRVLVLCHSLSTKDQQDAIEAGHHANPDLRTIVMSKYMPGFGLNEGSFFINPFAGPEALTASVREAMWGTCDVHPSPQSKGPLTLSVTLPYGARTANGWMHTPPVSQVTRQATFTTSE